MYKPTLPYIPLLGIHPRHPRRPWIYICPVVFYQCFGEERINLLLPHPKVHSAHCLQTNELKLKRETIIFEFLFSNETITLLCEIISSKLPIWYCTKLSILNPRIESAVIFVETSFFWTLSQHTELFHLH